MPSSTPEADWFLLFIRPLNRLGARYLVSGSVAAMMYGEPRLTNDLDIIIFLNQEAIGRLSEVFPEQEFYVPPRDVIALEVAREQRGHFNIIHPATGLKVDCYTAGRDELHAWAFRQARQSEFKGEPLVLAPPEYVIVRKLEYFREGGSEKHLRDIRGILNVSGAQLDRTALDEWIARRGLHAEWRRASA
jgi:hypothetical protein